MKKRNKKRLSENLIIMGISATTFIVVYTIFSLVCVPYVQESTTVSKSNLYEHVVAKNYKALVSGEDLIPNSMSSSVMRENTANLQSAIDNISSLGGGVVLLPSGTFYFSYGGIGNKGEVYSIRLRDNVHLIGAGVDERNPDKLTVLKPVHNNTGNVGSMDMFYFNNYFDSVGYYSYPSMGQRRDVSYTDNFGKKVLLEDQNVFLTNADFSNFVVDGENTKSGTYNTSGKGFAIKLFINCDWNNVVVKNTDATGFGMDFPINSTVKNCVAINCGKAAATTHNGASGFGIGTGVMNNESIVISNSIALNNKKYGFFFEHQARFSENDYKATRSLGFVVKDSIAGGNLYDFGGLKANDVTYQNVESISGSTSYNYNGRVISLNRSKAPANFSLYSVNSQFVNSNLSSNLTNLGYNTDSVKWAVDNGYIYSDEGSNFNANRAITREEAVKILYRYSKMKGDILIKSIYNQQNYVSSSIKNTAGFTDITLPNIHLENDNLDAILWGVNNGILSHDKAFRGSSNCTRAEFFTMLYRLAGIPKVTNSYLPFIDVDSNSWYINSVLWAYSNGITNGKGSLDTFKPNDSITKNEVAIALYRYNNSNSNFSISYTMDNNLNIGTYNSGMLPYTLSKPVRSGYTFLGWTGSNGNTPNSNVVINSNTRGNLSYVANWEATISSVSINSYPTKLNYSVGDNIDLSGLSLKIFYSDGSVNYIIPNILENVKFNSKGVKIVKLSYEGYPFEYKVTVS